jgi:ABC-type antimicrobial peptide transport system permease subunit
MFQGVILALVGVVVGLAAAFALARVLASLLFGVTARDPIVFAVVPLLLTLVAIVGSWIPARAAARIDPMIALRAE